MKKPYITKIKPKKIVVSSNAGGPGGATGGGTGCEPKIL